MTRQSNLRTCHWLVQLGEYDYEVKHRPGCKNGCADALSRCPLRSTCPYGEESVETLYTRPNEPSPVPEASEVFAQPLSKSEKATSFTESLKAGRASLPVRVAYFPPVDRSADSLEDVVELQGKDLKCAKIKKMIEAGGKTPFELATNGALYFLDNAQNSATRNRSPLRLVIPDSLKAHMLTRAHSDCHLGRKKTLELLSARYYWDGMPRDVSDWVAACLVCRKRKTPRPIHAGLPKSMCFDYPWHTVSIDLVGPYNDSSGSEYVVTMIDCFSRYVIVVPIPNKEPHSVAKAIYEHLICVFGIPGRILTDRGGEFINSGLSAMCESFNIRKIKTAAHNQQGNGHVERFHRFLNSAMCALHIKYGAEWSNYVHSVRFLHNMTLCESTGVSPHYCLFGRHPTLPDDVLYGFEVGPSFATQRDYKIHVAENLRKTYEFIREQQAKAAEVNRMAREAKAKKVEYFVGQPVLLWQPQQSPYTVVDGEYTPSKTSPQKWAPRWTGPHIVHKKMSDNTYDVVHGRTGAIMSRCNVNGMWPAPAWSDYIQSTSTDFDRDVPWMSGGMPIDNALITVVVDMDGDNHTFQVGKLLEPPTQDGLLYFQWMADRAGKLKGALKPGWVNTKTAPASRKRARDAAPQPEAQQSQPSNWMAAVGREAARVASEAITEGSVYWSDSKVKDNDLPYTSRTTGTQIKVSDLEVHSFTLRQDGTLPKPVIWAMDRAMEAQKA